MTTPTEVVGRYRLERRLGAGGMATVFLALDTVLERPVAVKLLAEHLAEDDAFVARFRREALAAARLQHPNIVQVYDSGRDAPSGRHYIVMEFVEGPSCADLLREEGRLDVAETVSILCDACRGLAYAHRNGVVHRDVKPGNLLVVAETGLVKLADFGIAKATEQTRITQVGSVLGTAAYLSPEQARGEDSGPASDIYSLGVCAYQFLTGRLPFEYASLTELALKQQTDDVESARRYRPEVPPALDRAVRICLAREPAERYASALELAEALEAGLRDEETSATARLAAEATRALAPDPDATRALPRTAFAPPPPPVASGWTPPSHPPAAPRAAEPASPPAPQRRRRGLGRLLVALLILALGVAAALAIISSSGTGGVEPVRENDVPAQVEGLKDLIQSHSG